MKKLNIIILFLTLLLSACNLEPKTLTESYKGDLKDVSKIKIVHESTGFGKEVTNKEDIDKFLNNIRDTKLIPEENKEQRDGSHYSVSLFENNEETFQFGSTPDIHPIMEQLYESIITNTPDDAIKSFEADGLIKNIHVIGSIEVDKNDFIYVFEGEHEPGTEYFLASVKKMKHNSMWGLIEAVNIGSPESSNPQDYVGIKNIFAGLKPISEKAEDTWHIIEIPDSEYYIWVEISEKR